MKKVVLITGVGSGIGKASAEFLASNGFIVCATTRNPINFTTTTYENLYFYQMDITNFLDVKKTIEVIVQTHGRIDILVNNAGYGLVSTVEDVEEKEMFDQFNINVFGLLRVCKAAIPIMREQKSGVIINISSFLGKIGLPLLTFYNASKYAVEGITDSLRHELKSFNIRAHSIMPGFFNTNFAKDNLVVNNHIFDENSPYSKLIKTLTPTILEQINNGNDPALVAQIILDIIYDENYKARTTAGEKASKFIPMKKELSDEDFEQRVREYYTFG